MKARAGRGRCRAPSRCDTGCPLAVMGVEVVDEGRGGVEDAVLDGDEAEFGQLFEAVDPPDVAGVQLFPGCEVEKHVLGSRLVLKVGIDVEPTPMPREQLPVGHQHGQDLVELPPSGGLDGPGELIDGELGREVVSGRRVHGALDLGEFGQPDKDEAASGHSNAPVPVAC